MKRWIHASDDCEQRWERLWSDDYDEYYDRLETDKGYAIVRYRDNDGDDYYACYVNYTDGKQDSAYKYPRSEAMKYVENLLCSTEVNSSIQSDLQKINKAKAELAKYDKEKVDYVNQCQGHIMDAISKHYTDEGFDEASENVGSSISEIKRDWMLGAIENDLMTEEEFEDILDLLDTVDLAYAAAYS